MGDIWAWLISFFFLIALVGIIVYQLVCLADLEFDYINPYDSASRINYVVLPEFIVQGVLCVFYLFTGHWFMAILCLPYMYYNFQLDIPMAQFIVNMNNSMPSSQKFIIHVLDSTHMFVQPHVEQMIRSAVAEFRDQNSYEKPT
ncbi:hypothetical protein Bca101_065778 [Brassica carinata]